MVLDERWSLNLGVLHDRFNCINVTLTCSSEVSDLNEAVRNLRVSNTQHNVLITQLKRRTMTSTLYQRCEVSLFSLSDNTDIIGYELCPLILSAWCNNFTWNTNISFHVIGIKAIQEINGIFTFLAATVKSAAVRAVM